MTPESIGPKMENEILGLESFRNMIPSYTNVKHNKAKSSIFSKMFLKWQHEKPFCFWGFFPIQEQNDIIFL